MAQFGTIQVSDALAPLVGNFQTVADFGVDNAYQQISEDLDAYNRVVNDEIGDLVEVTTDVTRVYGAADSGEMQEGDEISNPDAQKPQEGYPIQFPLRRGEYKVAWTHDFMMLNSVEELRAAYEAAKIADQKYLQRQFRRALFTPFSRPAKLPNGTDNANAFKEYLVKPQIRLSLYPLLNADGSPVPIGPNGEEFDPDTHTHYMASDWGAGGSTPATRDGDMQAALQNLVEHKIEGTLAIYINYANEAQMRGLPGFVGVLEANVVPGANMTYASGERLDPFNFNNRRIGTYRGFEVWVKPWVFPNYIVPICLSGGRKVLAWRVRQNRMWADFGIRYHDPNWKLIADIMARDGGCSVDQRHMAVVLYVGGAAYATPTQF